MENREFVQRDVIDLLSEGRRVAENIRDQISLDLEKAKSLNAESEIVKQIEELQQVAQQEEVAFNGRLEKLESPYVISQDLKKTLNVARFLEKPLLLEGEPGTGKTSLAYALAGHENLPIIHAQCKSSTNAQDLLYTFDVVQRLQDGQLGKDIADLNKYVKFGPLGRAFSSQEQVIVLIDEVDKAKRDFSNDLLHELDKMSFFVNETGEEVVAKHRPIVIVTSNHERDLPEPMLRRCIYSYIEFPSPEQMIEIIKVHVPSVSEKLIQSAIDKFYEIRDNDQLEKKPSTSEMLDWIKVLQKFNIDTIGTDIPFVETLLKSKDDIDKVYNMRFEVSRDLNQSGMPPKIIAALEGKKVVRLKKNQYSGCIDSSIYTLLANNNYTFDTGDGYRDRNFEIYADGVQKVDDYVFIMEDIFLYNQLKDRGLLASEFVVDDRQVAYTQIKTGNKFYVEGIDENGITVYRTKEGKVIYENSFKNQEGEDGYGESI